MFTKKGHKKTIAVCKQNRLHSRLLVWHCVGTDNGIHSYMHTEKIRPRTA